MTVYSDLDIVPGQFDRRFIRQDMKVGAILSFMAIAFGLAIASISSFPLMAGIISAVVGGIIGSVFGRSPTSIYGAAAALAPILAWSVNDLGHGDPAVGYPLTLAVIFVVGFLMTAIGHFRLARIFASFFSHAVICGMLASIAIILLFSRFPMFLGTEFEHKGFERVLELPTVLHQANPQVLTITLVTFAFLGVTTMLKNQLVFLKGYPPQLWAIPLTLIMSIALGLDTEYRINLPDNLLEGLATPDFSGVWIDSSIWGTFFAVVVVLVVVDTAETVATVRGISRIDRYKREADVDKTVRSMGFANIVGSLFGGMSNIPGGAKSTMATALDAKTAYAGIFCVIFVVIEVTLGRYIINLLPQAGLAAIIVFTVLKLVSFGVWKHFWKTGWDQFLVFIITFLVGVHENDILHGLVAGVILQMAIAVWLSFWAAHNNESSVFSTAKVVWKMMTDPLVQVRLEQQGDVYVVHFGGVWMFFKTLDKVFEGIPEGSKVRFHIGEQAVMIDADTMDKLRSYAKKRGVDVTICDSLKPLSKHGGATTLVRRSKRKALAAA